MSEHEKIIQLLQADIRGEHAAIIQYLQHVWRMEGIVEIPGDIEEISREEMRHFRWLCETIVDLGGEPTMERDPVFVDGAPPVGLMRLDVEAEDRAIEQYDDHIREIDDRRINRLLRRIVTDERAHREKFRGYVADLGGDPDELSEAPDIGPWTRRPPTAADGFGRTGQWASPSPVESARLSGEGGVEAELASEEQSAPPPAKARLLRLLDDDVMREYTTILQYLRHAFLHKNSKAGMDVQIDIAQWHMKHMGWLAELMAENGRPPGSQHGALDSLTDLGESLQLDLAHQRLLAQHYAGRIQQADDPAAKSEYSRVQLHQEYQVTQFEDLLKQAGGPAEPATRADAPLRRSLASPPVRTLSDLLGRPQDD